MSLLPMDLPESIASLRGKIHISAFRLLFIYLLLGQTTRMSYKDIDNHMLNHPLIENTFTLATIDQYIRTLRVFGCQINRYEAHNEMIYEMTDHPLKLSLSNEEINTLKKQFSVLGNHPIPSLANQYHALLTRLLKPDQLKPIEDSLTLAQASLDEKLHQYQRYCAEGQILEFDYVAPNQEPEFMLLAPESVVYRNKTFYLVGTNPRTSKKHRLILNHLYNPRQLPTRAAINSIKSVVTFKLTGRLTKNYKPYPGETVIRKPDHVMVTHTTDDVEGLIHRLMKYETHCQIVSPPTVKQEMLKRIEHLLHCHGVVFSDESATPQSVSRD